MDGDMPGLAAASDSVVPVSRRMISGNPAIPRMIAIPDNDVEPDDAFEALSQIANELARELGADAILIGWRDAAGPTRRLLALGFWEADALDKSWSDSSEPEWGPAGDRVLRLRIAAKGGAIMIAARFRHCDGAGRARAESGLHRAVPWIRPLVRLWALRLKSRRLEASLSAALDHSDVATILVDDQGELLFVNEAAERLIARGDGLRRTGTHLAGDRLSDTLRLQSAIEHALGEATPGSSTPVVALKRQKKRALLAAIVAHQPEASAAEAVIYVFDPEQDLGSIAEPACRHYGLSPVETRLACLLVEGASLTEAAQLMRVRDQTARTYLKQIFLKTDTNRQAEFVLLMLRSSVRLLSASRPSFF